MVSQCNWEGDPWYSVCVFCLPMYWLNCSMWIWIHISSLSIHKLRTAAIWDSVAWQALKKIKYMWRVGSSSRSVYRPVGGTGSGVRVYFIHILQLGLRLEIVRSNRGDAGGDDELWFRMKSADWVLPGAQSHHHCTRPKGLLGFDTWCGHETENELMYQAATLKQSLPSTVRCAG